jgi:hypothetical protein
MNRCVDWLRAKDNEFRAQSFLNETKASVIRDAALPVPDLQDLRTASLFGQYDFAKAQFPFRPFPDGTQFAFAMKDFGRFGSCVPLNEKWPAQFVVTITNPWVLDGLPISQDAAQRLVDRNPSSYARELGVNLRMRVTSMGALKPSQYAGQNDVPVDAEIVEASVDDGARNAPRTIFSLNDAYVAQRRKAQDEQKAAAKAIYGNSTLASPAFIAEYAKRFGKMPNELPKLSPDDRTMQLAMNVGVATRKADGSYATGYKDAAAMDVQLQEGVAFNQSGSSTPIHLDNVADFTSRPVPAGMAAFTANGTYANNGGVVLILQPVGYVDDKYLGTYLMAHISRVILTVAKSDSTGKNESKLFALDSTSPAVPYNPMADGRTAADLDIIGVKAGMAPSDVQSIVEKQIGQKLTFDEKAMTLSSPESECEFTFDSNKTPPGRKCFKAEFRIVEKGMFGNKLGLARAIYRQAIFENSETNPGELLKQKYGPIVYQANSTEPATDDPGFLMNYSQGNRSTVAKSFAEWGKRLTLDRRGMQTVNVNVPVHALEAEIAEFGDLAILTTTLTGDVVANELNGTNAAADAAKKAQEDQKKKADVKL